MLNKEQNKILNQMLQRIYAMPITKATLREVQNAAMLAVNGNTNQANALLEALITGEIKKNEADQNDPALQKLVDEYCVLVGLARDVYEKGEFINNVYSDVLPQPNQVIFVNRFKRIDGEEFQFLSDSGSTFQVANHFVNRLKEIENTDSFKLVCKSHQENLKDLETTIAKWLTL